MDSLKARQPNAGLSPGQPALGLCRRFAPRLRQQNLTFLCETRRRSSTSNTPSELDATEAAMREAKERMGGHGTSTWRSPKPVIAEAEDLKAKFLKIQAEVSAYKALNDENDTLMKENERLRQEKDDALAAREEVARLAVESARQEVEAARRQTEDLAARLAALQEGAQAALERAAQEAAGPLQQQVDELAMQLQNSQAQMERLGEAVEAAETDKAAAVQALQEERQVLLGALAGAAQRLADLVYPPGTLPPGLAVTTRMEGADSLGGALQTAREAAAAATAAAATAPSRLQAGVASGPEEGVAAPHMSAASSSPSSQQPLPAERVEPPQPQLQSSAKEAAHRVRGGGSRGGGFLGWLAGLVSFWTYQTLGALLLYYAAAVLQGVPPRLNLEFGLGCVAVCSVLSWGSRLLVRRFAW